MTERGVLKTVRFWIKAFIPIPSLCPSVYHSPGASTGRSHVEVPWSNSFGKRCFLGDNRLYSSDPEAPSRIHALVEINDLDLPTPTIGLSDMRCFESAEIDPESGVVLRTATAPQDHSRFFNLRANQTTDPIAGVITDSASPNFVQLDLEAVASLPLLEDAPDVHITGTLQIDRDAGTFTYKGKIDRFPCYEAWVSFNDGTPINLFKLPPVELTVVKGADTRDVATTVKIVL
ncbi:hypothetical protein DFQ26_000904, partial [Actinomortierella ambigua]